jgi:hypothetical protein
LIPINVTINKIDSIDNKICNKDITTISNKNGTSTSQSYNCTIHFNYNNKEIIKQISNSNINYTLNQTITVYYDKNNQNNDPEINMLFLAKYWWMFMLGGNSTIAFNFLLIAKFTKSMGWIPKKKKIIFLIFMEIYHLLC